MRVIEVAEFGGPDVLVPHDAPARTAGPGQAVVQVAAVDVLFIETQLRSGQLREFFASRPPYVPGDGVAGRVSSVGAGVDPAWVGRPVVARTSPPAPPSDGGIPRIVNSGAYAEQAVVAVGELVAVPDGLGPREAAALLHDGPTALLLLDAARPRPGGSVLVTAAAGGTGLLLVQLARAAGARVIGAARGAAKLDAVRGLGAEVAVDYGEPGWVRQVLDATAGAGVDVVFDGAGGTLGRGALGAVARGGRFLAYGASSGGFAEIDPADAGHRDVTVVGLFDLRADRGRLRRYVEQILADAAAGRVRPVVGQTFPLERAADAHAAIEARRTVGRTLLVT